MRTTTFSVFDYLPATLREFPKRRAAEILGLGALAGVGALGLALLTWSVADPSLNHATNAPVHNLLGAPGAIAADIVMQILGLGCIAALAPPGFWGWRLLTERRLQHPRLKIGLYLVGIAATSALASLLAAPGAAFAALAILALAAAAGVGFAHRPHDGTPGGKTPRTQAQARFDDEEAGDEPSFGMVSIGAVIHALLTIKAALRRLLRRRPKSAPKSAPAALPGLAGSPAPWMSLRIDEDPLNKPADFAPRPKGAPPAPGPGGLRVAPAAGPLKPSAPVQGKFAFTPRDAWIMPSITMLAEPKKSIGAKISHDALEQNARMLEGVLDDFGVKGEIVNVRPGPVVTLYELEPAPGIKSSRVIGLADDIAR